MSAAWQVLVNVATPVWWTEGAIPQPICVLFERYARGYNLGFRLTADWSAAVPAPTRATAKQSPELPAPFSLETAVSGAAAVCQACRESAFCTRCTDRCAPTASRWLLLAWGGDGEGHMIRSDNAVCPMGVRPCPVKGSAPSCRCLMRRWLW